ncbi:MAG: InlB B-repeat-containing protein, partial [Clostridia bacterium]|nr:InlB B-repeat-containing protein [Clostridia bacterium]
MMLTGYGNILGYAVAESHTYELSSSDGNTYRITVSYGKDAAIPDDAVLSVREITKNKNASRSGEPGYDGYLEQSAELLGTDSGLLTFAKVFDISLKSPSGESEYQPAAEVKVTIEILNESLENRKNLEVVHIPDSGPAELIESSLAGESVEFVTNGFSIYVLTDLGGDPVPMWTFTFYVWNSDLSTYEMYGKSQRIKNGEKPLVPKPMGDETREFAGWYEATISGTDVVFNDSAYDFDNIPAFTEDGATNLYARYAKYAYVIFHDQYNAESGIWPVAYTRRAELAGEPGHETATVAINDLSVGYTGSESLAFLGWSETEVRTPGVYRDPDTMLEYAIAANGISVDGDTHLYPIYKSFLRLNYYTAQSGLGASYIPVVSLFDGSRVPSPLPVSTRKGYVFEGWYTGSLTVTKVGGNTVETVNYGKKVTDANGSLYNEGEPYLNMPDGGVHISSDGLYLSSDATLYAKWRATYNVVIWKQSPYDVLDGDETNNNYDYYDTLTYTAEIGDTVFFDGDSLVFPGYEFGRDDGSKTVENTEEITVLNLYYDLTGPYAGSGSYTLSFADSAEGGTAVMPHAYDGSEGFEKIAFGESLAGVVAAAPADRVSDKGNKIFTFKGWYMDKACTVPADLSKMTMPDRDITLYAGWEAEWYLVQIDPNYGALWYYDGVELKGDGSTWFWQTYDSEPIGEYKHVTRDYVQSSSGTYYYVKHDQNYYGGSGPDRKTYYTQDINEATEDTTFEYSANSYTYFGWYEVYADGSEASQPYDFSQHTDHYTTLRLHWKKNGIFYVVYDAGDGELDDEHTKTAVSTSAYSDYAGITLSRAAVAPENKIFIGWQIDGNENGQIYLPGQVFTLHSDFSVREHGKDVVKLRAVYVQEDSADLIYNANGGEISAAALDYGKKPASVPGGEPVPVGGTVDLSAGTVTVGGLANNSAFILGSGAGFTLNGNNPVGWSTGRVYDPKTDKLYLGGEAYGIDNSNGGATTLYAVWPVQLTYHLNEGSDATASWGSGWDGYTYDPVNNTYTKNSYIGWDAENGAFTGLPADLPESVPSSDSRLFFFWTTVCDDDGSVYDFTLPVTASIDLYAFWSGDVEVPVHAVDASNELLSAEPAWAVPGTNFLVGKTPVDLTAAPSAFIDPPAGYVYAFAVALSEAPTRENVSYGEALSSVYYNQTQRHLYVKYLDSAKEDAAFKEGTELYFIYYSEKSPVIGYKKMLPSGELVDTAVSGGAPAGTGALSGGEYDMPSEVTSHLAWVSEAALTRVSFALGQKDPALETPGAPMNASYLNFITAASDSDSALPALKIRNTWQGIQYTVDGTNWTFGGYDIQLYVVYYDRAPKIIVFTEQTVGSLAVAETQFTFDLLVTQTTNTSESRQLQKFEGGAWTDVGAPDVTETSVSETVFDTAAPGNQPYILRSGEANSAILFYSSTESVDTGAEYDDSGSTCRVVTTTTVTVSQSAEITQVQNASFGTFVQAETDLSAAETRVFSASNGGEGGVVNVTFTNRHISLPVEIHVAVLENGSITLKDSEYRSGTYSFDLPLGESANF